MAGTKVYMGRLSYRVNEKDIHYFFRGYGKIGEIILKHGYGFVEFNDYRDADDAVHDLNGKELLGERVRLEFAKGTPHGSDLYREENRRGKRDSEKSDYRLILKNVSSRAEWQEVKDMAKKYGDVTFAEAHRTKKGIATVEFAHKSDMKKAIDKLDGKEFMGKKLVALEERKYREEEGSRSRSRSPTPTKSRKRRSSSRSRSRSPKAKKDKKEKKRSPSGSRSPPPAKLKSDGEEEEVKKEDGNVEPVKEEKDDKEDTAPTASPKDDKAEDDGKESGGDDKDEKSDD